MSTCRTLKWTVQAVEDLARIRAFIATDNPTAARRAAARIKEAATTLIDQPAIGRPITDLPEFRDCLIPFGRRGYVLRYRIEGLTIIVVRIWHGREDRNADEA